MKVEPPPPGEERDPASNLERALEELLVGPSRVRIDPATGQIIPADGEKSSLTDPQDPNTIA